MYAVISKTESADYGEPFIVVRGIYTKLEDAKQLMNDIVNTVYPITRCVVYVIEIEIDKPFDIVPEKKHVAKRSVKLNIVYDENSD